ncbi:MAG: PQQ-binding-like beta-propeller repeat protein [Actinomycetota bacterium]
MDDLRRQLEDRRRAFAAPQDGLDRLTALRRRRQRRRAASSALAVLAAVGGLFVVIRAISGTDEAPRRATSALTPRTVTRLWIAWTGPVESGFSAGLAVGPDEVFVHEVHAGLSAFPRTCSAARCAPDWTTALIGPTTPGATAPALSAGRAFVTSDRLTVFPQACGLRAGTCAPAVAERPPLPGRQLSAPTVSSGLVYVGTDDGRLIAYSAACDRTEGCGPVWSATTGGSLLNSTPSVSDGNVYVMSDRLYAFPAACGRSSRCRPRWTAASTDPLTAPASGDGMVFVSRGPQLLAFPASCTSPCPPAWTFRDPGDDFLTSPVVAGGTVYVLGTKLFALPARCGDAGGSCLASWTGAIGTSGATAPVTVRGGLVFVSAGRLMAFPTACPTAECRALWSSRPSSGTLSRASVTGNAVYVVSSEGLVTAYEVGARR